MAEEKGRLVGKYKGELVTKNGGRDKYVVEITEGEAERQPRIRGRHSLPGEKEEFEGVVYQDGELVLFDGDCVVVATWSGDRIVGHMYFVGQVGAGRSFELVRRGTGKTTHHYVRDARAQQDVGSAFELTHHGDWKGSLRLPGDQERPYELLVHSGNMPRAYYFLRGVHSVPGERQVIRGASLPGGRIYFWDRDSYFRGVRAGDRIAGDVLSGAGGAAAGSFEVRLVHYGAQDVWNALPEEWYGREITMSVSGVAERIPLYPEITAGEAVELVRDARRWPADKPFELYDMKILLPELGLLEQRDFYLGCQDRPLHLNFNVLEDPRLTPYQRAVLYIKCDDAYGLAKVVREEDLDVNHVLSCGGSGGIRGGDGALGNITNGSLLHCAVVNQKDQTFRWLLEHGADVNQRFDIAMVGGGCVKLPFKDGTALHLAALRMCPPVSEAGWAWAMNYGGPTPEAKARVDALLAKGADAHAVTGEKVPQQIPYMQVKYHPDTGLERLDLK